MRIRLLRRAPRRDHDGQDHDGQDYPYDPEHPDKPYEQVQRDIGSSLLLGAVVLVLLMILLVVGLS